MRLTYVRTAMVAALLLPTLASAQNRALGQPAFGSSLYNALRTPDRVVDGNTQGNYHVSPYIFHSNSNGMQWWYVDLGASFDIDQVVVYNRTDCCESRLANATLGIFAEIPYVGGVAPVATRTLAGVTTAQTFDFAAPVTGRYVGVSEPNEYLQLAEVQVFGDPTGVSAVPEPATVALVAGGLVALAGIARRRRA
jgi:hypothetical protein